MDEEILIEIPVSEGWIHFSLLMILKTARKKLKYYMCGNVCSRWEDGYMWMTVYPYSHTCERTGNELPGSVMLIARFTRVTPWMYV